MKKPEIGLIGLHTMGAALAKNIADKDFRIIVFNRTYKKTKSFINKHGTENINSAKTLNELVKSLPKPRKIMLIIKSGDPTEETIQKLSKLLSKNDTIIDLSNSNFKDTEARQAMLKKKGIHLIGCGISGGEKGALEGPSLMPGGPKAAYKQIEKIFNKIAAKDFNNTPCSTYIGEGGAGHFVKMVHNGIEYAIMQTIAETYDILRKTYKIAPEKIAAIFNKLNKTSINSYLLEITIDILNKKDDDGQPLIEKVLDKAEQKGTGNWTVQEALENSVPIPSISAAVSLRHLSENKELRKKLEALYGKSPTSPELLLEQFYLLIENALFTATISIFAQGFDLIKKTHPEINIKSLARIWQGGCIIRTKILKLFTENKPILASPQISAKLKKSTPDLRKFISFAIENEIATPATASALFYLDNMTSHDLPLNLTQAQRDYFGAHRYKRNDKSGTFHTNWKE